MAGQFDQKKRAGSPDKSGPAAGQEQDEGQEVEAQEPEHQRVQNKMGNQAVAGMLANQTGAGGLGGAGVDFEPTLRKKKPEKDAPAHGGDDDGDPGPLTVEDLTRSWNPGIKKSEDRPGFLEPMPDDELPPEDAAFLEAVKRCDQPYTLPPLSSRVLDGMIQPSEDVVRISLTEWARGAGRWAPNTLTAQLLRRIIDPPVPLLQDPHGRVLLSRSRGSAIAVALVLGAPELHEGASAAMAATIDFALELEARRHRVRTVQIIAEESKGRALPIAAKILQESLQVTSSGRVQPQTPTPGGGQLFLDAIAILSDHEDPDTLIPVLTPAPEPSSDDDPLGIDAVIEGMTGGAIDRDEPVYTGAVQAAERIAASAARSRVIFAGTAVAVAEVSALWSAGAPTENLMGIAEDLDRDVAACLQLLVEIARAAQRRTVEPSGLRAGLGRAAKALVRLRQRAAVRLVETIWGILPSDPDPRQQPGSLPDALQVALDEGRPLDGLAWLRDQPSSLDVDTAGTLLSLLAGLQGPAQVQALRELAERHRDDLLLHTALLVCLGSALVFCGDLKEAADVSALLLDRGRVRRNGAWVAEGALLGIEVLHALGQTEQAEALRQRSGHLLWRMGDRGALSLLARWQPPQLEADEEVG